MGSPPNTAWRRLFLLVLATLAWLAVPDTTTVAASAHVYDASAVARIADHEVAPAELIEGRVVAELERSASPSVQARGASTTSPCSFIATNIAPSEIRLSQATVNGPRTSALADDMAARGWQGDPVDVVRMPDGRLTTFDNKRVVAANDAGIDVSARVQEFDSPFPTDRLGPKSPGTWGEAVTQRIGDQKAGWRNQYPMGAPFTCRMGC